MFEADDQAARRDYLARLLEELCVKIGVRDAGSDADGNAGELLLGELSGVCDYVEEQELSFTRWATGGGARLEAESRSLECYPYYGSAVTGASGLYGVARASRPDDRLPEAQGLLVLADASDAPSALIVPGPFGPAVPRYSPELTRTGLPVVGVDRDDADLLRGPGRPSPAVHLLFRERSVCRSSTVNLIGTVDGKTSDEILLIAHRDTQYSSPGANDNAASLVVALMLAASFRRRRPRHTLRVLASAAEEIGCLGASAYAERRAANGTIGRITLCLNFDSLTYGFHPQITTLESERASLLAAAFRRESPASRPRMIAETDVLDGKPFGERGVPVVYLNSRGDDDRTLRLWHRPEDLPETVDPAVADAHFRSIESFLIELDDES